MKDETDENERRKQIFIIPDYSGTLALVLLVSAYNSALAATSGTHYPFGTEGVLAATVPPPGFHYRIYNSFYNPDTYRDNNGDEAPIGFDLDVFATVHRFVHVTQKKIFGADFMYDVIVPFVDKEISIDAFGLEDSKSLTVGKNRGQTTFIRHPPSSLFSFAACLLFRELPCGQAWRLLLL